MSKNVKEMFKDMNGEIKKERNKYPIRYFITNFYYRIIRFFEDIPLKIKTFFQRGKRGWANSDTWCYSADTEILTEEGWKYFKDLSKTEKVLTINPFTDTIEYQVITNFIRNKYKGNMISFKNKTFDLVVTPNHNLYLGNNEFIRADEVKPYSSKKIKCTGYNWIGHEEEYFILPSVRDEKVKFTSNEILDLFNSGLNNVEVSKKLKCSISVVKSVKYNRRILNGYLPEIQIKMDDWLAFLGIYIAEGWTNGNCVNISQTNSCYRQEIENLLNRLPFRFSKNDTGFNIYNKVLGTYLNSIGKANDKFIPRIFLNLSKRQLKILLTWYLKGDGYKQQNVWKSKTISKKLANDLQEIYFKLGVEASIHFYTNEHDGYFEISERIAKFRWFNTMKKELIDYDDYIYCVSVPNRVLYVRRNGLPTVCGNSFDYYLAKNIVEGLKYLKKSQSGHPGYYSFEEWNSILDHIIWTFKIAINITEGNVLYIPIKDWTEEKYKEIQETCNDINIQFSNIPPMRVLTKEETKKFEKGFDLFKDNFFSFWD